MNLGNGKGPKHTGRSTTNVAPPTSLSTNFFQKLFHARPAPLAVSPEPHGPQSITNLVASGFPLFYHLSGPSLKRHGCEKKFGEKFGENRGQDHCHRSQIPKCFYSTNCRDSGHQHTRRGKTNSPSQANQAPSPHRSGQGRKLASRAMKTPADTNPHMAKS